MQLEATLLTIAWLLPLLGFSIEIWGGFLWHRLSKTAAYMAVFCIAVGFVLSLTALLHWGSRTDWAAGAGHHGGAQEAAEGEHPDAAEGEGAAEQSQHEPIHFAGNYYELASFGRLSISLGYYIDSLTLVMFVMVTLISTCIHVFALGYMSDELTEDYVDHQVHVGGGHLHRPGRFHRFFAFMSLFCFSMLGLVISGNAFMTFVFWELVGICSYFLIGFYTERHTASTAANKAFIVNRIGDFGFLIGLMILWTWCGTLQYSNPEYGDREGVKPGLFEMVRGEHGELAVQREAGETVVALHGAEEGSQSIPYYLLVAAGLGIFAGCVGKSAQFPLQTWLPDAMEGPTPVSALVHSATMVAAGVYLVGRFYPIFTPEVLMTIAYVGAITLFIAATIAVVATDIKRVLAYSTISQLGYMMLALGVGGWGAGLLHLITHAFFKSLMFLCSGSVIVGCHHEQEMTKMGGLWRKMPITAFTMLVGVIAISGLAIPGTAIAFSGYHSKDAIIATALAYSKLNPAHGLLVVLPLVGAGITAFYMFRLWFYTFTGEPRDQHVYDHAKESPWVMVGPLLVLSVFAAFCAWGGEHGPLYGLLSPSEPAGLADGTAAISASAAELSNVTLPSHAQIGGANHAEAGRFALGIALLGTLIAFLFYGARVLDPGEVKRQLSGVHRFLIEKWWFDELYDVMFVRPVHVIASWISTFDRVVIDGILHKTTAAAVDVSKWDRRFDEQIVDGLVNWVGNAVFGVGRSLRVVQTGKLRQYIMFIAGGIFALLLIAFMLTL